ncbi:MAG: YdcF family protein [Aquificaceae bacterium]|nr:YdcF family protein [Aquificaceae bacterium]
MTFYIKKLITFILLPPTLFILIFLLIAFLSRRRAVKLIALSGALMLYLLSIEPVKDMLYRPLESSYQRAERIEADAIVVLGGGSYKTGILKEDSTKRLLTGFLLHKRHNLPIILSGGAVLGNLPEAEVMKQVLEELGVDKGSIITESRSRDTHENAKYVKEICQQRNFKKVVLVTSAYHMPRSVSSFKKAGLDVAPYPTDFKQDKRYNVYSLVPSVGVLQDSTKAVREHLGNLAYSLLY